MMLKLDIRHKVGILERVILKPGDFNTQIAIFEPQRDPGLHRSDEYYSLDVCIILYIHNSPRESNLPI